MPQPAQGLTQHSAGHGIVFDSEYLHRRVITVVSSPAPDRNAESTRAAPDYHLLAGGSATYSLRFGDTSMPSAFIAGTATRS